MLPLDRLVREPSDLAVAASFQRLNEAIRLGDQARIDLVLAEISGLAAKDQQTAISSGAVSRQPSGVSRQQSAVSRQPSGIPER
jgi:hypothetical protein